MENKNTLPKQNSKHQCSAVYSFVWNYFHLDDNITTCNIPVVKKNKQEACGHKLIYESSTSNMQYHLRVDYNIIDNTKVKKQSIQPIDTYFKQPYFKSKQQKLQHAVVEWIVLDNLSLNIIQD
ncbi:8923_t:CDS:1, partial [Racocetra persica]